MLKYLLVAITALTTIGANAETLTSAKLDSGQNIIKFEGEFTKGTGKRLYDYAQETGFKTVSFDSGGGIANEGLNSAWVMETLGLVGLVERGNACISACAITMLGAHVVEINGLIGFHPAYLPEPIEDSKKAFEFGQRQGMRDTLFFKEKGLSDQVILAIGYLGDPEMFFVVTDDDDYLRIFEKNGRPYTQIELLSKMWHGKMLSAYKALVERGIEL